MLIGINGGYFPAICRVCLIQAVKVNYALENNCFGQKVRGAEKREQCYDTAFFEVSEKYMGEKFGLSEHFCLVFSCWN